MLGNFKVDYMICQKKTPDYYINFEEDFNSIIIRQAFYYSKYFPNISMYPAMNTPTIINGAIYFR